VRALETRVDRGQAIERVASVASLFVSRVDTEIDKRIRARGGSLPDLQGKVAIAGARLAYASFLEMTRSVRWRALEAKGARRQRLLWASMGTKNPAYSDVLYLESLIGPETIATVPPETLRLFQDHGRISNVLGDNTAGEARSVMNELAEAGIDFADVNRTLEDQGIDRFARSFDTLLAAIGRKRSFISA
jgi:transaldolase